MIVLAVVAILAAVAWPTFDGVVTEQRRSDAVRALLQAQVDMERCQASRGNYTGCAPDNGQSPNGDYNIGVDVDADGGGAADIADRLRGTEDCF
jgi:type IV pilus assembly protein PilE